jgi:predicted dehydrogenase
MATAINALIIGYGSMGQRRARILKELRPDWKLTTVDPNGGDIAVLEPGKGLPYDAIFVCTPPNNHITFVGLAMAQRIPVFVEKPICSPHSAPPLQDVMYHADFPSPVMVGHNFMWHEGFRRFEDDCDNIGPLIAYHASFSHSLNTWMRDNKDSYSRHRDQGGGVLLDCLQDIDMALEITGGLEPTHYRQWVEGSDITVDSEYLAVIHATQPGSDMYAMMNFDYLGLQRVRLHSAMDIDGRVVKWVEDRGPELDASYVAETKAFVEWVETGKPPVRVPDPFRALEFVRRIYAI